MLTLPLLRTPVQVNDDVLALLALFDVRPADDSLATVNAELTAKDWPNALRWPNRNELQARLPEVKPLFTHLGFIGRHCIGASTGSYAVIPGAMATLSWSIIDNALKVIPSGLTAQPRSAFLLGSSVRIISSAEKEFLRSKEIKVPDGDVTEAKMLRIVWDAEAGTCFHRPIQRHCMDHGCTTVVETDEIDRFSASGGVTTLSTFRALKKLGPAVFAPGLISLYHSEPYGQRAKLEFEFCFGQGYNVNLYQVDRGDSVLVAGLISEFAKYLKDLEIFGAERQESGLAGLAAWESMH